MSITRTSKSSTKVENARCQSRGQGVPNHAVPDCNFCICTPACSWPPGHATRPLRWIVRARGIDDLRASSTFSNFEEQLPDNAIEVDDPISLETCVLPENDPNIGHQRDLMSKIHTSTEHLLNSYDRDWTNTDESYKMQVLMALVQKTSRTEGNVLIFSQRKPVISFVAARLRKDKSVHQRFATELEMCQKCSRIEDKILIFSHRQPIISYVAARLREEDSVCQRFATELEVVVIEGQVHPEKRQEITEAFNESEKVPYWCDHNIGRADFFLCLRGRPSQF